MDWMYKNSDAVDPEEYLLGKAIDKNFERRGESSEIGEKDFNKNRSSSEDSSSSSSSSLGSNVHRNNHDRTKSNRSRGKAEVARKEKRKYRQHHDDSSDESSPRKHEKRRNERTHVDVERQKVVEQTENRGLDSDDRKHRSKAERRRRSSTSSSASECEDQGAMSNLKDARRLKCKRDHDSSDSEKIASKKAYGLVLPKSFDASKAASSSGQDDSWRKKRDAELESKKKAEADKKAAYLSRKKQPAKLSQEEKEAKLREMMANGQQREKERKKNVTRYKMEERKEEAQTKYEDKDFIRFVSIISNFSDSSAITKFPFILLT
ncbi:unnamed protein product [Nesidiocoris tenuis]|uniref:Uncharacterized protein n=1 Tax=Nesidiocoris tenuis TaxID=355587 RepID=A0A6H5G6S1_9HEMI|nr:unnamed protein product [Nesidiocoris tenuis]CAB0003534.1 unnamed protein product [Nesidiocoris tenuis]